MLETLSKSKKRGLKKVLNSKYPSSLRKKCTFKASVCSQLNSHFACTVEMLFQLQVQCRYQ